MFRVILQWVNSGIALYLGIVEAYRLTHSQRRFILFFLSCSSRSPKAWTEERSQCNRSWCQRSQNDLPMQLTFLPCSSSSVSTMVSTYWISTMVCGMSRWWRSRQTILWQKTVELFNSSTIQLNNVGSQSCWLLHSQKSIYQFWIPQNSSYPSVSIGYWFQDPTDIQICRCSSPLYKMAHLQIPNHGLKIVFSICSWLNLWMTNPGIWRVHCIFIYFSSAYKWTHAVQTDAIQGPTLLWNYNVGPGR